MADSRRARRPLDPDAVQAANDAIGDETGGRQLTMGPEDGELRRKWMDAYVATGGEVEGEDEEWGDETPDESNQGCPLEEEKPEETYEWYFSA